MFEPINRIKVIATLVLIPALVLPSFAAAPQAKIEFVPPFVGRSITSAIAVLNSKAQFSNSGNPHPERVNTCLEGIAVGTSS